MPPLAPSLRAEQVADHYQRHLVGIRVFATSTLRSGPLYVMWTAVCSLQMKRIPGVPHPVNATQLASGVIGAVGFYAPATLSATTAYQPESLNNLSWILTIFGFTPVNTQNLAFGWAMLVDYQPRPPLPALAGLDECHPPIGRLSQHGPPYCPTTVLSHGMVG